MRQSDSQYPNLIILHEQAEPRIHDVGVGSEMSLGACEMSTIRERILSRDRRGVKISSRCMAVLAQGLAGRATVAGVPKMGL